MSAPDPNFSWTIRARPDHLAPINLAGVHVDSAGEGGWQYPQSVPSLALNPMKSSSLTSRPKLTLSAMSSPSPSPNQLPASVPTTRPPLLNAPSANVNANAASSSRSLTPSLKLAIPGISGTSSSFSFDRDYPGNDDADELNSELKTPLAMVEDQNPTLQARGRDYDGGGESSFGYGRLDNGLAEGRDGSQMSMMTEDIRQALSRSRFDSSPNPSSRSRASSSATASIASRGASRRSSNAEREELSLGSLSITTNPAVEEPFSLGQRRNSIEEEEEEDEEEAASPVFDPSDLVHIRRIGEGTGGAVELVQDPRTGRIMAKKVCRAA